MAHSDKIPTYSAAGNRLRPYAVSAVERLLSLSLVAVTRDRKGRICSAHFRPQDGANPLRSTCHLGQRYSFRQHVGSYRVWSHRVLIQRQDCEALAGAPPESPQEIDQFMKDIFRAVPLSILKKEPAKVVDINEYRQRKSLTEARQPEKKAA